MRLSSGGFAGVWGGASPSEISCTLSSYCARSNLQSGSPKEMPEEHFILKGVCGPRQLREPFRSFRNRLLAIKYTSDRLRYLTEDLKAAMDTIHEFENLWGCHYLLEEAMEDCWSVDDS